MTKGAHYTVSWDWYSIVKSSQKASLAFLSPLENGMISTL